MNEKKDTQSMAPDTPDTQEVRTREDLTDNPEDCFREALSTEANRLAGRAVEEMRAAISETAAGAAVRSNNVAAEIGAAINAINEQLREANRRIEEALNKALLFWNSNTFKALQEYLVDFSEWYGALMQKEVSDLSADELIYIGNFTDNLETLLPIIRREAEAYRKKTGADRLTAEEFFRDTDPDTGEPIESIYDRVLRRAKEEADLASLPRLESISKIPSKYVMPNNPIANSLTGRTDKTTGELVPVVNAGGFDLPVLNSGKKNEVTAYTMIDLEDADAFLTATDRIFTEFDLCVMNGIISLWVAGNKIITPSMVCRAMSNKTRTEKISPQEVEAATKSLEKMRHIFIKANLSDEMRKRKATQNGKRITEYKINDYLLSLRNRDITAGGKKIDAYMIGQEPVLLEYSRITRQLITVNAGLLDVRKAGKNGKVTTEVIPTTETRQPIKEYLLKRIEIMKHDRKNKKSHQDHHVLFDTLYQETGTKRNNKTELKRTRDYSFQVLNYWTAVGYIAGYEIIKQGRKLHSILIKL